MRKTECVFGEGGELVRGELRGCGAETLCVTAKAEEVIVSVDAGACAVGISVNVEGVIGDPVDEAAVAAVGRAAVVEEAAFGVGSGGDAVGDTAPIGTQAKEMAAVHEAKSIGELQAMLVGVSGAADA